MSLVARLAVGLTGAAARLRPPLWLDRRAAHWAIAAMRWYQRRLSHHSGRVCLFHPSCSHRAVAMLAEHGWRAGMPLVRAQVKRCGGDYTLLRQGDTVILETADGQRFVGDEVAVAISGPVNRR